MELFTVLLSSLLAIVSPVNLIFDGAVEKALRSRLAAVEQLEVRLDNAPSYQILGGKGERLRIASRGLQPVTGFRIEVFELEAETLNVDLQRLPRDRLSRNLLDRPLQSGIRLVLTETDLNLALQSTDIQPRLQQVLDRSLPQGIVGTGGYKLLTSRLQFDNQRVQLRAQLQSSRPERRSLDVSLETGIEVVAGHRLEFIEPKGAINGRPLSSRLLQGVAKVLSRRLDLRELEPSGITARLLQLEIEDEQIRLAAFVNVEAQ